MVGEVKVHLTSSDIKEFLSSIEHFKEYFPGYKDVEFISLVSGMYVAEEAKRFAYKKRLLYPYPIRRYNANFNPPDFKPKIY